MEKDTLNHSRLSVMRIIFGTLVVYLVYMLALIFVLSACIASKDEVINWILTVLLVAILFTYNYGILGRWLGVYDTENAKGTGGSPHKIVGIGAFILGIIGTIIRPYPILAYGSNKKIILIFTTAIPLAIFAIACFIIGAVYPTLIKLPPEFIDVDCSVLLYAAGVLALVNVFFIIKIKACPVCKCVMNKIDHELLDINKYDYEKVVTQHIGYVGDKNLYIEYNNQYEGTEKKYAKTFTCMNCGTKVQGKIMVAKSKDTSDPT